MSVLFINIHRPTHDDKPIKLVKQRERLVCKQASASDFVAVPVKPVLHASDPFEGNMLKVMSSHCFLCFRNFLSTLSSGRAPTPLRNENWSRQQEIFIPLGQAGSPYFSNSRFRRTSGKAKLKRSLPSDDVPIFVPAAGEAFELDVRGDVVPGGAVTAPVAEVVVGAVE